MKALLLFLLAVLWVQTGTAHPTRAETDPAGDLMDPEEMHSDSSSKLWIGIWTAYSPFSTSFLAKMEDTQLAMGGVEMRYAEWSLGRKKIQLSGEVILLGWTGYPKNGIAGPRESRFGVGAVPIRFSLPLIHSDQGNYPHFDLGLGLFFFDDAFPNQDGTFLNATVDLGIGYSFRLSDSAELGIGYRFHHLSNGGRGIINPGIDSNLIVLTLRART